MADYIGMNDNVLSKRWNERYLNLPENIRHELSEFKELSLKEYQLQVIKRKRITPKKGEVFLVMPKEGLYFWGVVLNGSISNNNGVELSSILVFKKKANGLMDDKPSFCYDDLLIEPSIVGKEYWWRGYFYNTGHIEEIPKDLDYGFYRISNRKFLNEYGEELNHQPELLGTYGVKTIAGIANMINRELIIDKNLLNNL